MEFDSLPPPVMLSILLHSEYISICTMRAVSKTWLDLTTQNQAFWRQKLEMDFGEWVGGDVDFEEEYKIEYGWRFREPRVVELGKRNAGIVCVKVKGSVLTCRTLSTVCVWDLDRLERIRKFCEFKDQTNVWVLDVDGDKLFVGFGDGKVECWSVGTGEVCHSWQAHDDAVNGLFVYNGRLMSSDISSLKVWDLTSFECLDDFEVEGFKRYFDDGYVIALTWDGLHVLRQEEGKVLYTLDVDENVWAVGANAKHVCVRGRWGIQVWDRETKMLVKSIDMGGISPTSVWCNERRLLCVTGDGCIQVWDSMRLAFIRKIRTKLRDICTIDCTKGRSFVGLRSGRLCMLDFNY